MKTYKLCVIILNYHDYRSTITCAKKILKQKELKMKIIIVDNSSPNNSYEILTEEFKNSIDIDVIKSNENKGYAAGNNFGLNYAKKINPKYVLISNSDVTTDDDYFCKKLIRKYESLENVSLISGLMQTKNRVSKNTCWKDLNIFTAICSFSPILKFFFNKMLYYDLDKTNDECMKVDCVSGSLFLCNYSKFESINFFDEGTFLYCEENILYEKFKAKNLSAYIYRGCNYNHLNSSVISSLHSYEEKYEFLLESYLFYFRKYKKAFFGLMALKLVFYLTKLERYFINLSSDFIKKNTKK